MACRGCEEAVWVAHASRVLVSGVAPNGFLNAHCGQGKHGTGKVRNRGDAITTRDACATQTCVNSNTLEFLHFGNAVGLSSFAQRRHLHVVNGNVRRSFPIENTIVGVAVKPAIPAKPTPAISMASPLISHLVLFGFIYPSERKIPAAVMDDLIWRLRKAGSSAGSDRVCRGTLLSRKQYLLDIRKRGFRDARLERRVHMDSEDIAHWTKAIARGEKARGEPA
jgi:hypothetical protein